MNRKKPPSRRADYPYQVGIQTRWADNDMFGHLNNAEYQRYFEHIVVDFLREACGINLMTSDVITFAAETNCRFLKALSYPGTITAGMCIDELGRSSARYGLALFAEGDDEAAAEGFWIHVYVDRATQRPITIPDGIRAVLENHRRRS